MSWIGASGTAASLLVLLYLPGWLGLRMLRIRGLIAVAAAPATTVAVLVPTAVALDRLSIPWGPVPVSAVLALTVVLCALAGRLLPPGTVTTGPLGRNMGLGLVAAMAFMILLQGWAFVGGMERPDAVQQIYDPVFHLNAADTIVRTGDASPFGGLDPMYGNRRGIFYPTAWHSIVALVVPTSTVVVATNTLMLLTGLVVWPLGVAALARVVAPAHRLVTVAAPVVAASFLIFPANLLVLQGMFPYCLALALAPAAAALAVQVFRTEGGGRIRAALAAVIACAGAVAAHGAGAGVLAVLLMPLLVQEGLRAARRLREAGRPTLALAAALAAPAVAVCVVLAALNVPRLRSMADFPVPDGDPWHAALRALTSATTIGWTSPWANAVVAVLVLIGVVVAARGAVTRWLVGAWVVAIALYVIAAGPATPLRALTGFWYSSHDRTEAMLPTITAVLGAMGVVSVGMGVQRILVTRRRAVRLGPLEGRAMLRAIVPATVVLVLATAFVTSGGFRNDERENGWTAWGFQPEHLIHPPYATEDELQMIRTLGDRLPRDAVVLGDPMNGATFVQAVGGVRTYLPHVNPGSWDSDQRYLMSHFRELRTDPTVCELVREAGITHFYVDSAGPPEWREQAPGLYDVDVSTGFELVASAGSARVYRITACG